MIAEQLFPATPLGRPSALLGGCPRSRRTRPFHVFLVSEDFVPALERLVTGRALDARCVLEVHMVDMAHEHMPFYRHTLTLRHARLLPCDMEKRAVVEVEFEFGGSVVIQVRVDELFVVREEDITHSRGNKFAVHLFTLSDTASNALDCCARLRLSVTFIHRICLVLYGRGRVRIARVVYGRRSCFICGIVKR